MEVEKLIFRQHREAVALARAAGMGGRSAGEESRAPPRTALQCACAHPSTGTCLPQPLELPAAPGAERLSPAHPLLCFWHHPVAPTFCTAARASPPAPCCPAAGARTRTSAPAQTCRAAEGSVGAQAGLGDAQPLGAAAQQAWAGWACTAPTTPRPAVPHALQLARPSHAWRLPAPAGPSLLLAVLEVPAPLLGQQLGVVVHALHLADVQLEDVGQRDLGSTRGQARAGAGAVWARSVRSGGMLPGASMRSLKGAQRRASGPCARPAPPGSAPPRSTSSPCP